MRERLMAAFLTQAGWSGSRQTLLAGDASSRRYHRLHRGRDSAVLMDSPGDAVSVAAFVRIAKHLSGQGLSAPLIFAEDVENGFLLLEDLGDDLFARLLHQGSVSETTLYTAAVGVLMSVQSHSPAPGLFNGSAEDWAAAADFVLDWYAFGIHGERTDTAQFRAVLGEALTLHADGPRVMILRDYHAENLLWLPERTGFARVGLLDFQLAQMGQPAYDLVSLAQDARRDVSLEAETAMVRHYLDLAGTDAGAFEAAYAVLGTQRALRILGVFAKLCIADGKSSYVGLIPRVWGHLQRNFGHPALAPLAALCADILPEPTPQHLERIRSRCKSQGR